VTIYYELDEHTVGPFVAKFLDGTVRDAFEVGDGNLNRVFRVSSDTSSVVVKQALPYLKVAGENWPLTRDRARIERHALAEHDKLAPGLLPDVLDFDEDMSAIIFEDLHGYESWRELLVAGRESPGVATRVGRYCASVLLGTSYLIQPSRQRKQLRSQFTYSELCLVTEDLIFTAPYIDATSNRFDPQAADLARALRTNRALRMAAAELRFVFKTRDEALIHGDLHTGSVLIGPADSRVIDLEFAFFGPFGFDPGLLLANLALAHIAHSCQGDHAFADVVSGYAREFWAALTDEARRQWSPTEPWYHRFVSSLLADAARFAGLEMVRRIVGLAHAKDIDSLAQPTRLTAQRRAITGGTSLIAGPPCSSIDELWDRATNEEIFE
jgi:5-methylthioribose kinase